jgi:hypothetical protein
MPKLGSTFDSLELNEEEEENSKGVNISKKPIKDLKRMEEPKKAQEARTAQEAQATKRARMARLWLMVKGILQATKEVAWVELEAEWGKVRAQ